MLNSDLAKDRSQQTDADICLGPALSQTGRGGGHSSKMHWLLPSASNIRGHTGLAGSGSADERPVVNESGAFFARRAVKGCSGCSLHKAASRLTKSWNSSVSCFQLAKAFCFRLRAEAPFAWQGVPWASAGPRSVLPGVPGGQRPQPLHGPMVWAYRSRQVNERQPQMKTCSTQGL